MNTMLRERIQYLCKQQNLSRKDLTDGLITHTHLSNILAGRYTLADDLAEAMAKRLSVTPGYLAKAEDGSDAILKQIEHMAETVLFARGTQAYLDALPLTADELALELGANLCAACLSYHLGSMDLCQRIHDTYLDFYLTEFPDTRIDELPPALRKMFIIYKVTLSRSFQKHDNTLFYLDKLLELTVTQAEMWIAAQKFRIEALINLRLYDAAQEVFDDILLQIRKENLLHHLTGLYIMRCAFYYRLKMYESAVVELAKAEESLLYSTDEQRSAHYPIILHNRMLSLIQLRMYDAVRASVEHYQALLRNHPRGTEETAEAATGAYLCAVLAGEEDWDELEKRLKRLSGLSLKEDQRFFLDYHYGLFHFRHSRFTEAEEHLLAALDTAQSKGVEAHWTANICVMLAEIAEQGKRYKRGMELYKMAYQAIL